VPESHLLNKRKAYVRVVERIDHLAEPIEIIAGVELDMMRSVTNQYRELRLLIQHALSPSMLRNYNDGTLACALEDHIRVQHPGRSYFIEIGRGKLDQYVQVFEP